MSNNEEFIKSVATFEGQWIKPKAGMQFGVNRLTGSGEVESEVFTVTRDVTSMDLDVMLRDEDGFDRQAPLSLLNAGLRSPSLPGVRKLVAEAKERWDAAHPDFVGVDESSGFERALEIIDQVIEATELKAVQS